MQACLQELIFRNLAHGLCDVAEAVRIADQVELFHMREKDRVADTVREIVHTAELMCHRMDISEGCVIECDTCEILSVSHLVAGLHVNSVCNCLREILGDHRDRHQVSGFAFVETYASIAWVRASIPVAAVRAGGIPTIRFGSLIAICGVTRQSTIAIFTCRLVSVMIQKRVISEAVPAVVLTAIIGHNGLLERSTPS